MIDIEYIKNLSSVKRFQKGSIIIQEGDSDTACMYILLHGKVGVYKNYGQEGQVFLSILNPADFFYETSLFLNKEQTASVVAEEDIGSQRQAFSGANKPPCIRSCQRPH